MRDRLFCLAFQEKGSVPAVAGGFNQRLQRGADHLAQAAGNVLVVLERAVDEVAKLQPRAAVGVQLMPVGGQKINALPHEEDHDEHQHDDGHAGVRAKEALDHLLRIHPQDRAFAIPDDQASQRGPAGCFGTVHAGVSDLKTKIRRREPRSPSPDFGKGQPTISASGKGAQSRPWKSRRLRPGCGRSR